MLDAIRAYEDDVGSVADIDTAMMAGASHPMGPLTLSDFVGLDTLASIAAVMHAAYGEERFAELDALAHPNLPQRSVHASHLHIDADRLEHRQRQLEVSRNVARA